MNARRDGSLSARERPPRRPGRRWALLSGLAAAVLAVVVGIVALVLLSGDAEDAAREEAEETAEESPARCERHGIDRPDPRAQPDPVSGPGGEALDAGHSVQLGQEFTSGDMTSPYHLFTRGVNFDEPVGVVVRLHGDGTDPASPFDAVEATEEGSSWYRQQGFEQVRAEYPAGYDHFSVPQARILDEALKEEPGRP